MPATCADTAECLARHTEPIVHQPGNPVSKWAGRGWDNAKKVNGRKRDSQIVPFAATRRAVGPGGFATFDPGPLTRI